jgi:ATP-dependent DNA helicase RecG
MTAYFDTPVEYLKGVGPQRAALLSKELSIVTYGDLIQYYPFRYEDRTRFYKIIEIHGELPYVQLKGFVVRKEVVGIGRGKRLVASFADASGEIELVWFQGINWINDKIKPGVEYIVFGKPARYGNKFNIAHPEIEVFLEKKEGNNTFQPVYPLTDKLRLKHLDSRAIGKLIYQLLALSAEKIRETLPEYLLKRNNLISKSESLVNIHFPRSLQHLQAAQRRLKFEELFYIQLRLLKLKLTRNSKVRGFVFNDTSLLNTFYKSFLPFELTEAQKKVIREIYNDLKSGSQMNRLLQGDVGSGKTIVAFICMLIVIGSNAQCALMAPTEILAVQHFKTIERYAAHMNISVALLTGSVTKRDRRRIHDNLRNGKLKILVGTHALLEEEVRFQFLGLAIVDEQHRFGVAQRSKLWRKNIDRYPHILVMTATPIPRTLAMTLYGDLEISVIDQLPKGRKPIKTVHRLDSHRLQVNGFLKGQIKEGRQVYIVYPLIEESEKLDLKHLMDGYESVSRAFPEYAISIVHGKMKSDAKDFEMNRFLSGETKIMVATTVVEVGVDVPNASVMVIENAERFGLSQLHQLRGRVGRGAEQSYCLLMTSVKLGADAKKRIDTMVKTNDGFEIAETDLQLRGPGDLMGTQQSGALDLLIADLGKDSELLKSAREVAIQVLESDPDLNKPEHVRIKTQIQSSKKTAINWSRIS